MQYTNRGLITSLVVVCAEDDSVSVRVCVASSVQIVFFKAMIKSSASAEQLHKRPRGGVT